MEEKDLELLWYLNITLSQVKEMIEIGKYGMAISFIDNAKKLIKESHPEAIQADE